MQILIQKNVFNGIASSKIKCAAELNMHSQQKERIDKNPEVFFCMLKKIGSMSCFMPLGNQYETSRC